MGSTDSLLFTCELKNVVFLKVVLPDGHHDFISLGDNENSIFLSAGFDTVSLNISVIDHSRRDFFLSLLVANASLLNGGEIMCEGNTPNIRVMAGCHVCSKF